MSPSNTLQVFTAPTLTPLFRHLASQLRNAPLPPRDVEVVVVQSQGMRRWLTLQIADDFGCAGSLSLPFPAHFVRDISERVFRNSAVRHDTDAFSRETLAWRVDGLLRALPTHESAYGPLRRYLAGNDDLARFGLASQIAARFDDYQLYRDDLLAAWEAGINTPNTPHALWQAALWRTLRAESGDAVMHTSARLRRTIAALHNTPPADLPQRISVFGVTTLPPLFIELLAALAQHIPVTVYCASINTATHHTLTKSLGAQSREFLETLGAHGATFTDVADTTPKRLNLLSTLQSALSEPTSDNHVITLQSGDASLLIHDAHGQMRQLEIVRDQLLSALANDPTLHPHDLLLLVPDATEWAPWVDAVFGVTGAESVQLPYRIADRPIRKTQPAAESLTRLMALQSGRLARSEVFDFLAHPLVRNAAGLTEADVDTLEQVTQRANVRWGYDANARSALGLPNYDEASWRTGLDRLLLGVAVGSNDEFVLDLIAESGDTAGDSEIVAKLANWTDVLARIMGEWRAPRTLPDWTTAIVSAIEFFMRSDDAGEQQQIVALIHVVQRLTDLAKLAQYQGVISFDVVRDWIDNQLDQDGPGGGFLVGGVTVAALKPMRSLPFRVIAVVGLDDGVFPRQERRSAFDMLEYERRVGDRDMGADDRQLFLDLLFAAQDRLILTYNGRDVTDNSARAPSVVLDELLDYLERSSGEDARQKLVVKHPLQPFSPQYFEVNRDARLFTYSGTHARASQASAQRSDAQPRFIVDKENALLLPNETLELTVRDLTDSWTNPSKFYCKTALGLSLGDDTLDVSDDELFTLNKMEQGGIKARVLGEALTDARDDHYQRRHLVASGALPIGALGASWYTKLSDEVKGVLAHVPDVPSTSVPVLLEGTDWRLRGRVDGIRGDCRYIVRAGSVRAEHRIRAWIEHVVMCAAREFGIVNLPAKTALIGQDGTDEQFKLVPDATNVLEGLIAFARRARIEPLPFFSQAGFAWFSASRPRPTKGKGSKTPPKDPISEAKRAYSKQSDNFVPMGGDHEDPHVKLCFRGVDPMLDHWTVFEQHANTLFAAWVAMGATE